MQTNNNSAFDLPIIPLAILNSIISQFPGLYNGTFPIRDPNTQRHRSYASRRSQGRIPRPSNPYIQFRAFLVRNKDVLTIDSKHQNMSKVAGEVWSLMSEEEQRPWYDEAETVKEGHSRAYPGFANSPSPSSSRSQKRRVRKRRSEEEERVTNQRCHLAATQRLMIPDASEPASGNESDGGSEISTISDGTTPSLASPSPSSSSSSTAGSTSASIVSYAIGNNLCPMSINAMNILPSNRNDGIQHTSGWTAQLSQQSPFHQSTFPFSTAATGTVSPANLTMGHQQQQPVDIWSLRETNSGPIFTGSSSSSSTNSTFGINVFSSSTAFGQTCWNTTTTRSGSTLACPGSSKGKERQVYFDDSDDDFYCTNEDDHDAIDEDSDFDY